jgi:rhodanese-related sulfurtransferase
MKTQRSLTREIFFIVMLSVILAFTYNALSGKRIPLIRKEIEKMGVPDSVLFGATEKNDTTQHASVKVIAPLHERALANADSIAKVVATEKKNKEIFRIVTLDQMKRLMVEKHPLIFDARDTAAFHKGHVKGARNIFGQEAGDHFNEMVTIPRDTLIIIYCNNPECQLGRMLAEFMGAIGFTDLLLYDDGWDGWEKAKMPVDSTAVGTDQ